MPVTEEELAAKATGPRVTKQDLLDRILHVHYFTAAQAINAAENAPVCTTGGSAERMTLAILVLNNGYTVTGQSACASAENFDPEIGRRLAYEDAENKLWPLLGFELRTKLAHVESAPAIDGRMKLAGGKTYVGTKVIHALPMTRGAYNELRGWELPADELADDPGYLVEYTNGGAPNVEGFSGYVSWSPAHAFEDAYEQIA